jgi:hypothetical protein
MAINFKLDMLDKKEAKMLEMIGTNINRKTKQFTVSNMP